MNLEKAFSRSSDPGLAGWIASNDATLFTMVLVVVMAIFLHARLSTEAKEKSALAGEKQTLTGSLASTTSELKFVTGELAQTTVNLNLTQEQRDQLRQQLVAKLEQVAQLDLKIEALLQEKDLLQSQHQALSETKKQLTTEKSALTAERASLIKERDRITAANTTLQERLDAIVAQLAEKVEALEQVEQARDRLKTQADQLSAIVTSLKQKLDALNVDLAKTQTLANESDTKVQELQTQLAAGGKRAEEYLVQLKRSTELLEGLELEKLKLQQALTESEKRRNDQLIKEGLNNRELVGLRGRLQRVAIVLDASGSMRQQASGGSTDRWAEAQAIVARWLQHLNVEQCVLIVFSTDVKTLPADDSLLDLRGPGGDAKRQLLLRHLQTISPEGWTNTLDALRKAYEYDADTILLFSDGAPSKSNTGLFDPAIAQQVYALCREHPQIPINTIGLGNYFDEDMSTFLRSVASLTGGTFRGN